MNGTERPDLALLTNPTSDRVRSIRKLSGRSARLRAGRFVVEGPQAVREAVRAAGRSSGEGPARRQVVVHDLYATVEATHRQPEIVAMAAGAHLEVRLAGPEVIAAMADTVSPQGWIAICDLVGEPLDGILASAPRLVAVLSQVRDPGNAGTVIRAADAAGADAVVLTSSSVDVHNSKCVRATAGSLFHMPIVHGEPLETIVEIAREAGLRVFAADGAGDLDLDELQNDSASPLADPTLWIFGNEAWGLPGRSLGLMDAVVRVPVYGSAESLNLATAATVCLYASARMQRTLS
jgi:TrmH family RNA methyltransferase